MYSPILFCLVLFASAQANSPFYGMPFNDRNYDYEYYNSLFNNNIDPETSPPIKIDPNQLTCRDEMTGEALDWFTLYKLPKRTEILETSRTNNSFIYQGTAYTYMTNQKQTEWSMSDLSMNDTNSMAGRTLDILYRTEFGRSNDKSNETIDSNLGYILYNDQADKVSMTRGHTKGIILFNENSAIWVVHSIPHFPPKPSDSNYQIHHGQCVYGQQFLCMSIKPMELEKIGQQLLYTYPQIYDSHIPEFAKQAPQFKNLMKVLNNSHTEVSPWSNLNYFETVGGEKMLSFAKFTNFEDDLYAALVAPHFKTNLYTETWNNGRGTLQSNCSTEIDYQVHNVEQVNFGSFGVRFSVHHDHSKWAVTTDKRANSFRMGSPQDVACIGDINRQEEQYKRAGGTVCFVDNRNVWQQYSKLVDQVEPCRKKFRTSVKLSINKRITQGRRIKFAGSRDRMVMLG